MCVCVVCVVGVGVGVRVCVCVWWVWEWVWGCMWCVVGVRLRQRHFCTSTMRECGLGNEATREGSFIRTQADMFVECS